MKDTFTCKSINLPIPPEAPVIFYDNLGVSPSSREQLEHYYMSLDQYKLDIERCLLKVIKECEF